MGRAGHSRPERPHVGGLPLQARAGWSLRGDDRSVGLHDQARALSPLPQRLAPAPFADARSRHGQDQEVPRMISEDIHRVQLANLPTPVEPLTRLTATLGLRALWIKRDDLTGLAFGGNKTRKLELLLADAEHHGARTLITRGAVQSNHCRQTAAAAARMGLECILVLAGRAPDVPSGNYLLDRMLGAEVVWTSIREAEATLDETFQRAEAQGRRPYRIPYGGANAPGAAARALAIQELLWAGLHGGRIGLA